MNLLVAVESSAVYTSAEHRRKPRLAEPLRAIVHGVGSSGQAFMAESVLDDISAGGLYLRLAQAVEVGMELVIISKLATSPDENSSGPLVVISGTVTRAQFTPDDLCGVAVEISNKLFL